MILLCLICLISNTLRGSTIPTDISWDLWTLLGEKKRIWSRDVYFVWEGEKKIGLEKCTLDSGINVAPGISVAPPL